MTSPSPTVCHALTSTGTIHPAPDGLWRYQLADGTELVLSPPCFEVDGRDRQAFWAGEPQRAEPRTLSNGCIEHRWRAPLRDDPKLELELVLRVADNDPVVRFHYRLHALSPQRLTKRCGEDRLELLSFSTTKLTNRVEIRLTEFDEMIHSYSLTEDLITSAEAEIGTDRMGPIITLGNDTTQALVGYEHGSTHPDRFLQYDISAESLCLRTVKGSYWDGQELAPGQPYTTPWMQLALLNGSRDDLAHHYRRFVLEHQAVCPAAREPWIFYNTWNYQERRKHWHQDAYLSEMNLDRMLAEIDAAAAMGIEVFVIDTGWYEKTGDWIPSNQRFPDGLTEVRQRIEDYGMRLGLWFAPGTVAMSSRALAKHEDCIRHRGDGPYQSWPVWETEDSISCCLVSRYGASFADDLIRLHRELGVTYFKWDAIDQYGCDQPDHGHGSTNNDAHERSLCYAFQQPLALAAIVERVQASVPEAICDFDITEPGRSVGLAFLAHSKYFLINNGPYFHNYDNPHGADGNSNVFFFPGQARARICRSTLAMDRWIPSVLFLTHYLPDDGACNQMTAIASLILGHNGIWGDLCAVSAPGRQLFASVLTRYKQVRHAITRADPVRRGRVGGDIEVHEKLERSGSQPGRGAVVLFAAHPGTYTHTISTPIDTGDLWTSDGLKVTVDATGHAHCTAQFTEAGAHILFCGRDD
ncbi:MAG: alpha-galactosidase [Planctomycetota bacterium]|jgi:alpha-galactosidase|nr:alpha-galactosidase [Planctomycetota bacterium]